MTLRMSLVSCIIKGKYELNASTSLVSCCIVIDCYFSIPFDGAFSGDVVASKLERKYCLLQFLKQLDCFLHLGGTAFLAVLMKVLT